MVVLTELGMVEAIPVRCLAPGYVPQDDHLPDQPAFCLQCEGPAPSRAFVSYLAH